MPNLVVYVPTKLWQRLEEELGEGWPAWAREATVKHIREMLSERDHVVQPVSTERDDEKRHAESSDKPSPRSESRPRKRLYACDHFVPPSKVCDKCDVA